MNKLNVFICENYSPEFEKVAQNHGFDEFMIKPFLCMCENKKKKLDILLDRDGLTIGESVSKMEALIDLLQGFFIKNFALN
jgi:hypothetical protein